jgi:hypothetical protein
VDHTFLRARDSVGSYGTGLRVGETPQLRYRNAVMYLGLIKDLKVTQPLQVSIGSLASL